MAAAEINELFEEAITRSAELADAADEAMNTIDETVKGAEELAERVREEGTETSRHLRDLVARLEQAGAELEAGRGTTKGALAGLAGKGADLEARIAGLLERIEQGMAHCAAEKARFDDSLEGQMASTRADLDDLAQKTRELDDDMARQLEQAAGAISAFRAAIDAARAEFAQRKEAWLSTAESLVAHAEEQAEAWVSGINDLLARQAESMVDTANAMVDHHNEAMDGFRRRFTEDSPRELASALEPLTFALERLGQGVAARHQEISSSVEHLGQSVTQAQPAVDAIRAVLQSTARLG